MTGNKLTPEQIQELDEKIEAFDKYIESSIEIHSENEQNQIQAGEYKYLVKEGDRSPMTNFVLNEVLQEELDKHQCTTDELVEFAIENDHFKMKYEELANPFLYGSAEEDEFQCINWGGDKDVQIDKNSCIDYKLSTISNLKSVFPTLEEFEKVLKYEIGHVEHSKHYYKLFADDSIHTNVVYNTSYDVVRCVLSDDEELIKFIQSKPIKKDEFIPKVLKISEEEYEDLRESNSGFCVYCGKINDGFHEPDAENYQCDHCEKKHSFGVEQCRLSGSIEIVDQEDSELEDAQ